MNEEKNPSFLTRVMSVNLFAILTISSLAWFFISAVNLFSQLRFDDAVVTFDKGAMYMLGVGAGLLCLTAGGFIEGVVGKELTPNMKSLFKYGLIASIFAMVVLPHLAHYLTNGYAQKKNYDVCHEVSYHWLLY